MWSGPFEYKNIKRLKVVYPEYDDKHRQPILCRARDMGKVIYGKWIIGGEQWSFFSEKPYSDDEEKFDTAYKLVGGAKIICNFELEEGKVPCTTFVGFTNPVETPPPQDAERLYIVDKAINNVCGEPETDALDNGMIYIKMPSGVEAKQTDGAAEEKFTDRPQILKGDIVRFISALTGEENVDVVRCENTEVYFNPAFGKVLAAYRFDGRDFKCVWESVGYQFDRFKRIIDEINKTQLTISVKLKSVNEAMERYAKEVGDKASE